MRSRLFVPLALLHALTAANPASGQQRAGPAADSTAIAALIEEVQAANNAGDVARWVSLFASDFVYMSSGAPAVTSRQELVELARTGFQNQASVDIAPEEITVIGDWAFARNHVTGTVKLRDSQRVIEIDLKQLVIYRRNAQGRWQIARLMSNTNSS